MATSHRRYLTFLTLLVALLLALVVLPTAPPTQAAPQSCSGLFISEYIEGSSYNKAIEIFNGTGAAVDLSQYAVRVYRNGSATYDQTIQLSGTLADNDVFVVANDDASFAGNADLTSNKLDFNGDDGVALVKNDTIIDFIGDTLGDPGSEWGSGLTSTKDNTLRRKSSISTGDNNPNDAFDPAVEWDGYAKDTFDGLGSHNATCADGTPAPTPTPGGPTSTPTPTPAPTATPTSNTCSSIPEIQGTGNTSPCLGHQDNIVGCITGVTSRGFFFQDINGDGDPNSSDGIYAYFYKGWTNPANLQAGQMVKVSGTVTEYYDTTEFANKGSDPLQVTVTDSGADCGGAGLPTPVSVAPISDPNADPMTLYEKYEGMRVKMSFDGFVVGPTKRFISDHPAGDPEIAFVDQSSSIYGQRVFENDYPGYRGTNYISGAFDKDLPDVDFGDSIAATDLIGVMGYQFSKYTLLVDGALSQSITVTDDVDNDDSEDAAAVNEFTLCTFNIENMFDLVDDNDGDMGDWVPASTDEYNRMLEKRAKTIANNLSNCTIIGVQEVEGKDPVWDDLVAAIRDQGGITYHYDYYESIDPRDITTGILYDPSRVTLNASSQKQGCSSTNYGVNYSNADNTYGRAVADPCTSGSYPLFNRPPYLAQLTVKDATGNHSIDISVIVNHFKSKRGDESRNLPRREAQAQHVVSLMQAEYDAGHHNSVTLGDFNDVLSSTTLDQFDTNVGSEPLVNMYLAHVPENDRYSYIFSGESEVLDHFIMTSDMDDSFMEGRAIHINADFPDVPNMGTDNCSNCVFSTAVQAPKDTSVHRSSDHDPVLTRFSIYQISLTSQYYFPLFLQQASLNLSVK